MGNFKLQFRYLKVLLLLFGLGMHSQADAIEPKEQDIKFGLTGAGCFAVSKLSKQHISVGFEAWRWPILFFEGKFANWFGLRSGIGYSDLALCDVTSKHGSVTNVENIRNISGRALKLKRVSVPLVARFYPGDERKFCLYVGPRFGWIVGGKSLDIKKEIVTTSSSLGGEKQSIRFFSVFGKLDFGKALDISKFDEKFALSLDFGFDYEINCGLIFGMEGLGFALGYNFAYLL